LSVRAAFPSIWDVEERGPGSIIRGFLVLGRRPKIEEEKYDLGPIYLIHRPSSGYPDPSTASGILGVVFDSCSLDAQEKDYYDKARIPT